MNNKNMKNPGRVTKKTGNSQLYYIKSRGESPSRKEAENRD